MDSTDLAFAGISRQAQLLRDREITSVELVETYLGRIDRHRTAINPFTAVYAERAVEAARRADERLEAGEEGGLLGVPIALKDEIDVEGERTSHGTAGYPDPAGADAAHWRRLSEAGAILLAKTTLPELAITGFTESETFGETRNPWDLSRTPGGSSGGSAAAVAAGLVGAASASDGAGSIRIPASNCGLFGLKPQRGRISLAPEASHWLGLSKTGCVTRTVTDTALWLDLTHGPEPGDAHTPPAPQGSYLDAAAREPGSLRIAWSHAAPRAIAPPILDDEVAAAVEGLAECCADLGHEVSQRDPEWGMLGNDFANVYLKGIEEHFDQVPLADALEPRTRGFKRLARLIPGPLLRRSQRAEQAHAERVNRIFTDVDVLLTPVAGTAPVEVGRWAGQGALRTLVGMSRVYPYTGAWNYTGQPAASIPAAVSSSGLPIGVQAIVAPNREDLLLSLGAQLEREIGWPEHRPPLN